MGHHINALIGSRHALADLITRFGAPGPTDLPFDLVILPLDEQRLDMLALSTEPAFEGFTYFTPAIAREIGGSIGEESALYIETDYFGGAGGQSAALFSGGVLSWTRSETSVVVTATARTGKSPISEGLAMIGVTSSAGRDEFDQIGLAQFRSPDVLGLSERD